MCSKRKYQFLWEKASITEVTFEALRSEKNKLERTNLKFAVAHTKHIPQIRFRNRIGFEPTKRQTCEFA